MDCNQYSIVQIVDDDKSSHIVTAVNIYEALPEMSSSVSGTGGKETVGVATGPTFCTTAWRWDSWDAIGPGVV